MLSTHSMFRRRWFVLHENTLFWYKSSIEVSAGLPPQGIILLSSAYEVRALHHFLLFLVLYSVLFHFYYLFICLLSYLFIYSFIYLFIYLLFYFFQVRESVDPDAPENSIDIVTNAKVEQYPI